MDKRYTPLYQMVLQLGAQGMSSDESDSAREEPRTFTVRRRVWRSDEAQKWIRFIDNARKKTSAAGRPLAGNPPRRRIHLKDAPISSRDAIAQLPKNLYRENWLNSLTDRQYRMLAVTPPLQMPEEEIYDT